MKLRHLLLKEMSLYEGEKEEEDLKLARTLLEVSEIRDSLLDKKFAMDHVRKRNEIRLTPSAKDALTLTRSQLSFADCNNDILLTQLEFLLEKILLPLKKLRAKSILK